MIHIKGYLYTQDTGLSKDRRSHHTEAPTMKLVCCKRPEYSSAFMAVVATQRLLMHRAPPQVLAFKCSPVTSWMVPLWLIEQHVAVAVVPWWMLSGCMRVLQKLGIIVGSHSTITQTLKWANTVQWCARGVGLYLCPSVSVFSADLCLQKAEQCLQLWGTFFEGFEYFISESPQNSLSVTENTHSHTFFGCRLKSLHCVCR